MMYVERKYQPSSSMAFFFLDIFVTQLGRRQRVLRIIAAATSTTILESLNNNIVLYHKRINIVIDGV
jgi:hypothetical protein